MAARPDHVTHGLPMLAFEVPLGLWLMTRGVAADPHASAIIRAS
jgi:hypothetical protein